MYLLRRAAVRTTLLQPCRLHSAFRVPSARASLLQPCRATPARSLHQCRIWRAEDDRRPGDEATVEELKEEAVEAAEIAEAAAGVAENAAGVADEVASVEANATPLPAEPSGFVPPEPSGVAPAEDVAASAAQTAQIAAEAATAAAASARVAPESRSRDAPRSPFPQQRQTAPPNRILYIGNLFFEVTPAQLEAEFAKFGQVTNSRVVTDARGLSKGFGYVEFGTQDGADRAVREADQKVFQGRRMAVQYHVRRDPQRRAAGGSNAGRPQNSPSQTLFIGNMSYQMSDRDLNDLFREIRDVVDIRVAVDRRTGQPRGFAHADFTSVEAAQRAKEILEQKTVYGRQIRVDFGTSVSNTTQPQSP